VGRRPGSNRRPALRLVAVPAAVAAFAFLAGCASVGDTRRPDVQMPAGTVAAPPDIERWWMRFDDPALTALIDEALAANLDLQVAAARIDEARASVRLARASLFPSLDAQAGASRSRRSLSTPLSFPGPSISNDFTAGLQASYELDVWGRLAAGRTAAGAALLASTYGAQTVRIALAAQVASTWFTLRAADLELQVLRDTLVTREDNVRLLRQRFDAGYTSEFELRLAEAERAAVAAGIPAAQRAIAQTEAALAVLAGRSPAAVYAPQVGRPAAQQNDPARTATVGPEVPDGLTSDLLQRRPDLRQAEAGLAAADARIAEARAQYFPSLTLTAAFGGESGQLSDLFTAPARVWSLAANLLQPIIGTARIGADVDAATARREQARLQYLQAVQAAFRDVHDALASHRSAREVLVAQDERRGQLARALGLAQARYKSGYATYLEVLDAQRGLLDAERARVNAARDRQLALVDLYKALGGGWTPR
jgi:multidrug efflux system outer membrane protein